MEKPERRQGLAWREIDGLVVIVDPVESTLHDLSEVASFYWLLMDGQHTADDLVNEALREFDIDQGTAEEDLAALVDDLKTKKLLAGE